MGAGNDPVTGLDLRRGTGVHGVSCGGSARVGGIDEGLQVERWKQGQAIPLWLSHLTGGTPWSCPKRNRVNCVGGAWAFTSS